VDLGARYVIEGEIGRGGMSTVYRARDTKHERPVAVKVLHGPLVEQLGRDRVRREIITAANLRHPHIVAVYDSGETPEGLLWFTMPLIDGETLREKLVREHQLPFAEAVAIARDLAAAIDAAHAAGVVHRDIKPENVLLADGHAMLADFGVARPVGATDIDIVVGTAAYMSPEQARGEPLDGRTDIYSFGAVVREMLTGVQPVSAAIQRAMSPVAADRFPTATAFVDALGNATTTARPAVRWAIAAGGVALGIGLTIVAGRLMRHGSSEPVPIIAVLPFESGSDTTGGYIAQGLSDDIRGKLSGLNDAQVIASASTRSYRNTTESPTDIARELGARYLLMGRAVWSPDTRRLHVAPELVEVVEHRPPITRWGQSFDIDLADVWRTETDVATRVAQALNLEIAAETRARLARRPTTNVAAWQAYQRGVALNYRGTNTTWQHRAATELERATALDPSFVAAWAAASRTHATAYLAGVPPDPADSAAAHREADQALALAPDQPDGHVAQGTFQQLVRQDFAASMQAYREGLVLAPNDATLLGQLAFTEMRAGRWADALVHFEQARRLNPRSVSLAINTGLAYLYLRRYADARAVLDGAAALAPGSLARIQYRVEAALGAGDTADAHAVLRTALTSVDTTALVAYMALSDDLVWALDSAQRRRLLTFGPAVFDNVRSDWGIVMAQAYMFGGDTTRARAFADTAHRVYETQLRAHPDDPQLNALNGVALAYLGRRDDAVREGARAVAIDPIDKDATLGAYVLEQLARIYVAVGEPDSARRVIGELERAPGLISPGWLRIDPNFAALRLN